MEIIMFAVNIICHGTIKEQYLRDAIAEYSKRLSAYCTFNIYEAKDDQGLFTLLDKHKKDYKIALCIEGKQIDSPALAKMIGSLPISGYPGVSFLIGGSDGMPEQLKALCDYRLSFSKMTFPHQLMRVILCEQIYRAYTILNNQKYHK